MLRRLKNCIPADYSKCKQTVTVYRQNGTKYERTVYNRAFFDFKKTQNIDKVGTSQVNAFLLVIPGNTQTVFVGDKVYLGDGPEITTREDWAAFIPSKIDGLVTVKYADPKYWNSQIIHTEAGG